MICIVYKATNTVNGKAYIGVTRQPIKARMAQHKARAAAGHTATFHAAIRKYGWDAFSWETLESGVPIQEIEAREVALISQHNTFVDAGHGYNRTLGGGGTSGLIFNQEQIETLRSASRRNQVRRFGLKRQVRLFHNRTGIPHTDEVKEKIAQACKALPLGTVPAKLPHTEWPRIRALRESGLSFRKIGEMYGVRPETVFYFCRRREVRPA